MNTRRRTALVLPALAAATVLVLSACSGGTEPAAAAPSAAATDGPARAQQQDGGPGRGGASGEIASVTGSVMQLRSTDSQTAVTWTDTTTFTAQVAGTLSDVSVGACVVAAAAPSTSSGSSGGSTGTDTSSPIAATSIRITEPADDGTCTLGGGDFRGGPGGGGGDLPDGAPTDAPNPPADGTAPSGAPSGAPGQLRMFGGGASGKVTAVDGGTITLDAVSMRPGSDDTTTTSRTVTVSADTAYTRTQAADATAVVVGQCATARGEADDSGKVTATTVSISAPTDGSCTTGFVMNGGPGGFTGGGPGGQQGSDDSQGGTDA